MTIFLLGFIIVQAILYSFVVFFMDFVIFLPIYYRRSSIQLCYGTILARRFLSVFIFTFNFISCIFFTGGVHIIVGMVTSYYFSFDVGVVHTLLKLIEHIYGQFGARKCTHCSWLSGRVRSLWIFWDWTRGRRHSPEIPLFFTF